MSVTFTAELGQAIGYVLTCGCAPATRQAARYGSYDDAAAALKARNQRRPASTEPRPALAGCEMPGVCPEYPLMVDQIEDVERPKITLSTVNAIRVLDALGYVPGVDLTVIDRIAEQEPPHPTQETAELAGQAHAAEFLGRVVTALALAPVDDGMPAHQRSRTWIECGRRPGYLQQRLEQLHRLAEWCAQHGRAVHWH